MFTQIIVSLHTAKDGPTTEGLNYEDSNSSVDVRQINAHIISKLSNTCWVSKNKQDMSLSEMKTLVRSNFRLNGC